MRVISIILLLMSVCSAGWAGDREENPNFIQIATIAMEARSESMEGQTAIGEVIRNRAFNRVLRETFVFYDGEAPDIMDFWRKLYVEECLRNKQFSCWNNKEEAEKHIARVGDLEWIKARDAWNESQKHLVIGKATHYYSTDLKTPPYWVYAMRFVTQIGKHRFYEEI